MEKLFLPLVRFIGGITKNDRGIQGMGEGEEPTKILYEKLEVGRDRGRIQVITLPAPPMDFHLTLWP